MSRVLNAVIDEERNLVINPSEGFAGEHNAEIIQIDIGPFADEEYDYYILNFDNFAQKGKIISNIIRTASDEPSYIDNGVICCPLTSQLTAYGRLRVQLEAHKNSGNGEIVRKSSVAELEFRASVMGEDDMMDSSSSVHGRLDDVEKRLDEIDSENYSASIVSLESRTDSLEARTENSENSLSDAGKRLASAETRIDSAEIRIGETEKRLDSAENSVSTLEGYDIPQTFDGIEERLASLEERPVGIGEIPVASEETLGGVRISPFNELKIAENGEMTLNYANFNYYLFTPVMILASVYDEGRVNVIAGNTTEEISSYVYQEAYNVLLGTLEAFAFVSFSGGTVEYMDENYEFKKLSVQPRHIYVFKMVDGVMNIDDYSGNELRTLLLEGI